MAGSRRRGAVLESALLQAAADELDAVGYAGFTMDGVAARAKTSRMVLYRRWPNRAQLVLAVMRGRVTSISEDVPDTGHLRDDVLALVRQVAGRYRQIGPDIVHGLLAEVPDLPTDVWQVFAGAMTTILDRAVDRGEIGRVRMTPRLLSVPADLVRREMLLTRNSVPDVALVEIVEDIFLPLVHAHGEPIRPSVRSN